jgi:hypothetical protein
MACGVLVAAAVTVVTAAGADDLPAEASAHDDVAKVPIGAIVRANLEPSYLAYPIGVTGLDPLFFETSIVPNFSVLPRRWRVALFLTPKIVLRMFREDSEPVKTPSYMPRLTAFFWFEERAAFPIAYFSVALEHHSNGQSGPFTHADGTRNHDDGSFDTNSLHLAVYPIWWKSPLFAWNSISVEYHPPFLEDADLRATYGATRIQWATTLLTTRAALVSQLSVRLTAIVGDMAQPSNASAFWARFPALVRYTVRPPAIDVGIYAAYYQGQDYYNIWYDRFISVFAIGISGNLSTGVDFDLEEVDHRTAGPSPK